MPSPAIASVDHVRDRLGRLVIQDSEESPRCDNSEELLEKNASPLERPRPLRVQGSPVSSSSLSEQSDSGDSFSSISGNSSVEAILPDVSQVQLQELEAAFEAFHGNEPTNVLKNIPSEQAPLVSPARLDVIRAHFRAVDAYDHVAAELLLTRTGQIATKMQPLGDRDAEETLATIHCKCYEGMDYVESFYAKFGLEAELYRGICRTLYSNMHPYTILKASLGWEEEEEEEEDSFDI